MVTIINYHVRKNNEGNSFIALELQGAIEMIQSASTGNFYMSAKRCSMSSTFSEEIAKTLIGKQLPGKIERLETVPYEYLIKETNQMVMLSHRYVYSPDEKVKVLSEQPAMAV